MNTPQGQEHRPSNGSRHHLGHILATAFAGDRALFADGAEGYLYARALASGEDLGRERRHDGPITAIAVQDGIVITTSLDGTIRIGARRFRAHSSGIHGLAVMGKVAATAGYDGTVRLWNCDTLTCDRVINAHSQAATDLAWVGRDRLVSSSRDRTLKVWDVATGTCLRTLTGHGDWVTHVAGAGETRRVVSVGEDGDIRLWDVDTAEELGRHTVGGPLWSLAVDPEGSFAVAGPRVTRWDLASLQNRRYPSLSATRAIAIGQDAHDLLLGDDRGAVTRYDLLAEGVRWQATQPRDGALIAVARHGHFAIGHQSGSVTIDGARQNAHQFMAYSMAALAGGRLATGGFDGRIQLWSLDPPESTGVIEYLGDSVFSLRSSADGEQLLAVGDDAWMLWRDGKELSRVEHIGSGHHTHGDLSADGNTIATVGVDERVRLWDPDGTLRRAVTHEAVGNVSDVCLLPDGSAIILATASGKVFELTFANGTFRELHSAHEDWIRAVDVTSDGRYVVSTSQNFRCRIYDRRSGALLPALAVPIDAHAIDEDNRVLGIGRDNEVIRIHG